MLTITANRRVLNGASLLDKHFGPSYDWRSRVDLDILDMRVSDCCVLGCLFGSYYVGLAALGLGFYLDDPYGFNAYDVEGREQLGKAWITYLNQNKDENNG
jgi:hypothetical protein